MSRKPALKWQDLLFSGELLAGGVFCIYLFTLCPGVYGFDSAELATGVFTQGIVHPPGFPLYMLVGKVFSLLPLGSINFRLNLMSAVFGAATIYFLYRGLCELFQTKWIAWVASAFLAFSIYFWQMSLVAEVYTLHTFFLAVELFLVFRWRRTGKVSLLVVFAWAYGLSLTNHTTGLFFAPAFVWLVVSSPKWNWKPARFWIAAIALFCAGLLLYLYIPIRAGAATGLNYIKEYYSIDVSTVSGLLWMISGRAYSFFAFGYSLGEVPAQLWLALGLIWRSFIGVGALVAILGVYSFLRHDWENALGCLLIFMSNFVFYVNYRVLDKDTMFLPTFFMTSIFIAAGLKELSHLIDGLDLETKLKQRIANLHPGFWLAIVLLACVLNWQWVDMSHTIGPESYSNMVLSSAAPNSTIVASWSPAVVLEYEQLVEGKRPDLKILNRSRTEVARYYTYWSNGVPKDQILPLVNQDELEFIDQCFEKGNVYSIEFDPDLATAYTFTRMGVYYQLHKK